MRCLVFAYDFPHWKSWQGLLAIVASGFSDILVLAAPRSKLSTTSKGMDTRARSLPARSPGSLCNMLGIPYNVASHSDTGCVTLIRQYRPDVGVVLGARVLHEEVLAAAGCPIINVHPGVLPTNRGLDCTPWAVVKGWPQGVAVHVLTNKIDNGPLLSVSILGSLKLDETLLEISARVDSMQLILLTETVVSIASAGFVPVGVDPGRTGNYHSRYPGTAEELSARLNSYRVEYHDNVNRWKEQNENLIDALSGRFETFDS